MRVRVPPFAPTIYRVKGRNLNFDHKGIKMSNGHEFNVYCPQCDADIGSGDQAHALRIAQEHEKKSIGQHKPEIVKRNLPSKKD